jgi:hypothetical protein
MPNIGSIGWIDVKGATHPELSHNASTIQTAATVPDGHYCLLYGPVSVAEGVDFKIGADAWVKIKPFADV